jgi:hypothetical protein
MPTEQELATMGKYNQQLIDAGVMVDGAGLQPTSKGARVGFKGGKVVVTDGPFMEAKESVGGFTIFELPSKDEAIALAKTWPGYAVEIRPVLDM